MNEKRDVKMVSNSGLMTKCVLLGVLSGLVVETRGAVVVPPVLAAPRLAVAPVIDGAVGEKEWAAAAVVDGFEALSVQTAPLYRTRAWVGFDADNLYVAARCWMPSGARPRADAQRRDDTVFTDDAVEILLDPGRRGSEFQFIGNSIGTMFDAQGAASAWNAKWSYAARPTDIGWEGEWAIPFASVGRSTPQEGEVWGLLIGRDAWTPTNEFSQWGGCRVTWHAPTEFGSLVFHAAPPRIILREVAVRGLRVNMTAEAVAPKDTPATVTFQTRVTATPKQTFGPAQEIKRAEGKRSRKAGERGRPTPTQYTSGSAELRLSVGERRLLTIPVFPKEPGSYALEINAVDGQGKPLLVQRVPLEVLSPLAVDVRRFPTAGVLEIAVDATPSGRAADVATFECRLQSQDRRKLWSEALPVRAGRGEFRWTGYGKLKPGDYRLSVRALDIVGREVAQTTHGLCQSSPPEWLHNRLGREDTVIAPWTPVEVVKGNEVRVWGRRYVFGPTGLPEHLESVGADLLAAPMRLAVEADGATLRFEAARPLAVTAGQTRAVVRSRSRAVGRPGWELRVNTTVEFDGFAWVELSLSNRNGRKLDKLWLEMPLAREHARYFLPVFNGSTSIPAKGLAAPVVGRSDWERQETVGLEWVGDDDRGFAWSAEDDRHWASANRERALELVPGTGEVLWRAHFVDRPVSLNQPLTLSYCFLATPAKPNDRWYAHRTVGDGGYDMVKRDQPRAVTLRYPADRVLRPERGALEIDAVILFDPAAPREQIVDSANNRDFFSVDVADHGEVISFWPADARTLAVVEMVKGQDRARLYGGWRPKLGQRFRLSYVWGGVQALYLDGQQMSHFFVQGLQGMRPGATLTLGGGKSQWLIVAVKTSTENRITTEGELTADEHTLLLERLDQTDHLLEGGRTRPIVAPEGVVGVVSEGVSPATRHGVRGLALDSFADPISGVQAAYSKGLRAMHIHEHWTEIMGYPGTFTHQGELKALMEEAHRVGMTYCLYSQHVISSIAPEFEEWGHEWSLQTPLVTAFTRTPPQNIHFACKGTTWTDFYVYNWVRLIREFGVNGMYLDGTYAPSDCTNPYHDHALKGSGTPDQSPDGTLRPTLPIRAAREFMKRMLRACRREDPSFYFLGHGFYPFTGHFLDCSMQGENFYMAPPDFELPLDHLRAIYTGRQWGVPKEFYTGPIVAEPYVIPLALLHGIGTWGRGSGALIDAYKRPVWDVWEQFGIEDATFVGYWRDSPHVVSSHPDVKVSYHLKPGQVLLAVASAKRDPPAATITIDLVGLGLNPATLRVTTGSGRPLDVKPDADGRLRLRFPDQTNVGYYVWLHGE